MDNVRKVLEGYTLYPHIFTAGEVAEIWRSGFCGSVLVLNMFSDRQGKIKIETDCGDIKYIGESELS